MPQRKLPVTNKPVGRNKPAHTTAENGVAGGCLRVSMIDFPPECRTVTERSAFMEVIRNIRKAELVKEAAKSKKEAAKSKLILDNYL